MAAYHNLLSKNDRALVAYLATVAVTAVPAKKSADKSAPIVICWSERAEEVVKNSGTYKITASIMVKAIGVTDVGENAEAARLASDQLVQKAFDAFHSDISSGGQPLFSGEKLGTDITTAAAALAASDPDNNADLADYTCIDVMVKGPEASFEEDCWVDTLNLEIIACPKGGV